MFVKELEKHRTKKFHNHDKKVGDIGDKTKQKHLKIFVH